MKYGVLAILALLPFAWATDGELTPSSIEMGTDDTAVVLWCMTSDGEPVAHEVTLYPVCKDVDGIYGCQKYDVMNPEGFSVTVSDITPENGCTDIMIDVDVDDEAVFYYTVNGQVSEVTVSAETGRVHAIPEFSTVLSLVGLAGIAGAVAVMRK